MRFVRLTALVSVPCSVIAWGWEGHEIVGTIAQMYMTPTAVQNACTILGVSKCHLGPLGPWADEIKGPKYNGAYSWASGLHFVNAKGDNPGESCSFGEHGWQGHDGLNVLGAIRNVTNFLINGRTGADEALKFLIHFLGDMHQPLHSVGREIGGNRIPVTFHGNETNFHAAWDTNLVRKAMDLIPDRYNQPSGNLRIENVLLDGKEYNPYIRKIVTEGLEGEWKNEIATWTSCPGTAPTPPSQLVLQRGNQGPQDWDDATVCPFAWASEIHPMNCDFVWPKQYNGHSSSVSLGSYGEQGAPPSRWNGPTLELDEDWYAGIIMRNRVLDRLFAKAGVRLAAVLNHALATRP